jgi:hypothetical protein
LLWPFWCGHHGLGSQTHSALITPVCSPAAHLSPTLPFQAILLQQCPSHLCSPGCCIWPSWQIWTNSVWSA